MKNFHDYIFGLEGIFLLFCMISFLISSIFSESSDDKSSDFIDMKTDFKSFNCYLMKKKHPMKIFFYNSIVIKKFFSKEFSWFVVGDQQLK